MSHKFSKYDVRLLIRNIPPSPFIVSPMNIPEPSSLLPRLRRGFALRFQDLQQTLCLTEHQTCNGKGV
jgi:hypothetical protein